MSQNLIIGKLSGTVPFVVIFIVENNYINEEKNLVICLYLMLRTETLTPTFMINTVIIFLTSIEVQLTNHTQQQNNKSIIWTVVIINS